MSNTNTGGPAFPAFEHHAGYGQMLAVGGMTLRDYFAAKAMQAIVLDHVEQRYWGTEYGIDEMLTFTAERAYQQADAMLKAREAK
jgi:hypothetical protein